LDQEILGFSKLTESQKIAWILILKEFNKNHCLLLLYTNPQKCFFEVVELQESKFFTSILSKSLLNLISHVRKKSAIFSWTNYESNPELLKIL